MYPMQYNRGMILVHQTDQYQYAKWFESLRDRQARARIDIRVRRLSLAEVLIVLLAGGDKRTQDHDIRVAKQLARELQE